MVDLILPSAATKASSFHSNSLAEVTAEQKAQLAAQQQQQQDQYSVGESQAMAAADAVQMLADGSKQINLAMGDDGQVCSTLLSLVLSPLLLLLRRHRPCL